MPLMDGYEATALPKGNNQFTGDVAYYSNDRFRTKGRK